MISNKTVLTQRTVFALLMSLASIVRMNSLCPPLS